MENRYKFRAWDKKINYMMDVGEIHFCVGGLHVYGTGVPLGNDKPNDDSVILMQYTGLKDKNGKEIYEGDVVEDKYSCFYTVTWHQGGNSSACFLFVDNNHKALHKYDIVGIEIIGNIYENPELLK